MNPFKLLCLLLMVSSGINAQSIRLKDKSGKTVNGDTLDIVFHPGPDHGWTEMTVEIFIQNISNYTLKLGAKKTEYNMHRDEYHSICFGGTCMDSSTFISPYIDFVIQGGIDSSFSGHYRFDDLLHVKNECLVAYTFYNIMNTGDSAIVYVNYNTMLQSNGVQGNFVSGVFLSEPWPNPANDLVFFQRNSPIVNVPMTIIINNILGEKTETIQIPAYKETWSVNTSSFPTGIYYCSFFENNEPKYTKKMMVSH